MNKQPKPKSAPPRLRSKFVSTKTNTKKEIETWIRGSSDSLIPQHDMSRMCGQLTDNVTEERMLKAKLWELGKERYKFLCKNDYEKKMFIEKLKRKSGALQNLLKDPDFGRRLSLGTLSVGTETRRGRSRQTTMSAHESRQPTIVVETDDKSSSNSRQHLNSATLSSVKSVRKPSTNESVRFQSGGPTILDPLMKFGYSQTPSTMANQFSSVDIGSKSWVRPTAENKRGEFHITNDPRYYRLEHSLTPNYYCRQKMDVKTVVDNIESLHVPPKIPSDARPKKLGIKVQNFMKERGIVF